MEICRICNKEFFQLRPHLKKHKITWQNYQQQFNEKVNGFYIPKKSESEKIIDAVHRESVWRIKGAK